MNLNKLSSGFTVDAPGVVDLSAPFASHPGVPVDTHFHIFAEHQSVPGARYQPGYTADLADWAAAAKLQGVRRGVLIQPSFLGVDNRLLLSALAANSALRGVVVVEPQTSDESLLQMHQQGVRGIRLNLAGQSHDVALWCAVPALWRSLLRLGWHLQLHTDSGALPAVMAQLLPHLPPGLPLVLDHFAKPLAAQAQDATVLLLRTLVQQGRSVFVKLSGHYRLGAVGAKAMAQLWLDVLGPAQLLWGSDWPCTNAEQWARYPALYQALGDVLADVPDAAAVVHAVLTVNPHRLYV
jgi:predicted TIM-barrel fold metal-dependent hydrolase